jgi:hypothetical protein
LDSDIGRHTAGRLFIGTRAAGIQQRLLAFARDSKNTISTLTVEDHPYWSQIKAGQENLMCVSE